MMEFELVLTPCMKTVRFNDQPSVRNSGEESGCDAQEEVDVASHILNLRVEADGRLLMG